MIDGSTQTKIITPPPFFWAPKRPFLERKFTLYRLRTAAVRKTRSNSGKIKQNTVSSII